MKFKLQVLAIGLLVLCGAQAQSEGLDKMMQSDLGLIKNCGISALA